MKISVILCTYNRCRSLEKALESASLLRLPDTVQWEVLVVDNNSRDDTRRVVDGFCVRYPARFRYIFEPRQGKSHALTAGVREARGDILAFMDDDVVVDRLWLHNLTVGARDESWQGAGGRIIPHQEFSPPCWLDVQDRYALAPLAIFDLGERAGELTEPPFGTNMAFRKEMFAKHGGFRIDLGPQPGNMIRGEDTEFGYRLLNAGAKLRYEPSAIVYHEIPENRLRKDYFLAWWCDKARADVRTFASPSNGGWLIAGIPLVLFRRLAVWAMRWMLTVEPSRRFSHKIKVWSLSGQIAEYYYQASLRAPPKSLPTFFG